MIRPRDSALIKTLLPLIEALATHTPSGVDQERTELLRRLIPLLESNNDSGTQAVFNDPSISVLIPALRHVFFLEQMATETQASQSIIKAVNPTAVLRASCKDAYKRSASLLYSSIRALMGHPGKMLYVGSGPFPLNPILMAKHFGAHLDLVDRDRASTILSKRLVRVLGLHENISIVNQDIRRFLGMRRYDTVIIAAMVGDTPSQRRRLVQHVVDRIRPHVLVVIKNFGGLKSLLCSSLDVRMLKGINMRLTIHKYDGMTNEFFFVTKADMARSPLEGGNHHG